MKKTTTKIESTVKRTIIGNSPNTKIRRKKSQPPRKLSRGQGSRR